MVVKTILFRFKNLRNIHVQQISILNCRTSSIICRSASVPHQWFCFYNIKWSDLFSFGYFLMRTVLLKKAGGHLIHIQK